MQNKVFLNPEGIIEQSYIGDQTAEKVRNSADQLEELIDKLKSQDKRALVLADLSKLGKSTSESRSESVRAINELQYDKIAVLVNNMYTKYLATFVIKPTGKGDKVKVFEEREKAIAWLKEK